MKKEMKLDRRGTIVGVVLWLLGVGSLVFSSQCAQLSSCGRFDIFIILGLAVSMVPMSLIVASIVFDWNR